MGFLPFYAAWRLLVLLSGPPRQWVRTPREPAKVEKSAEPGAAEGAKET
jgi:hypothetical protein